MSARTILVCEAQVPFVTGGAEAHVRQLVEALRQRGFEADLVSVPFTWNPKEEILAHAAAWRLLNLNESNGRRIDRLIVTKFPTYFARHDDKVAWLIHQHRAAYELCGTPYSDFGHTEQDVGLRETLMRLDGEMLGECRRIFANARNTAARLAKYNGLQAEALYHPPRLAARLEPGRFDDYVLSVGRLELVKRVDLIISAMSALPDRVRLIVAGDGSQRGNLEQLAEERGLDHRITFLGAVDDDALVALYRDALAVVYPPFDEDFGYVTLEAFLASKPVITCRDSGGPTEFVVDGENGVVCEPSADGIGAALARLADDRGRAAALGAAGYEVASRITWDGVVEKLVAA
jgi:glycosyltransferase involved in cell wall biosynthesis